MWTTVLVLAIAVNFEPFRTGLVPLLLARPRPLAQLLAYLAGSLTVSFSFGMLILFVAAAPARQIAAANWEAR